MENDRYNFGKHYLVLDTKLENHINAKNNPHNVTKADVALSEVENRPLEDEVLENSENYVTSGAVYVVKEELESKIHGLLVFETFDEFPEIGVDNVIYIATDTNKQYRWDGAQYVELSCENNIELYDSVDNFPEEGKYAIIYVAKDTNKLYRWSDGEYINLSEYLPLSGGTLTGNLNVDAHTIYGANKITVKIGNNQIPLAGKMFNQNAVYFGSHSAPTTILSSEARPRFETNGDYLALVSDTAKLVEITWADLKALRDGGNLVPGRQYRITDYTFTTTQERTASANHQFDIIVTADSGSVLNEDARAALHSGDTYFANSNLSAWKLKYCFDNDTSRFYWADNTNGKGVIYRLVDEYHNDLPYDFKNALFRRIDLSSKAVSFVRGAYYSSDWRAADAEAWINKNKEFIKYMFLDFIAPEIAVDDGFPDLLGMTEQEFLAQGLYYAIVDDVDDLPGLLASIDPDDIDSNSKWLYTFSTTGNNGIIDASVKQFNYSTVIADNIFRDPYLYKGYAERLSENVFYSDSSIQVRHNIFYGSSTQNTFGWWEDNMIKASTYRNFISNFSLNFIYGDFAKNWAIGEVWGNTITGGHDNIIAHGFNHNIVGEDFSCNTCGQEIENNIFYQNFRYNRIDAPNGRARVRKCQFDAGIEHINLTSSDTSLNYIQNVHVHSGISGTSTTPKIIDVGRNLSYTTDVYPIGSTEMFI